MLPPLHKVDSPIEFVMIADGCWDRDKLKEIPESEKPENPFYRYHLGETRFELTDEVRAYMKATEKPVIFTLRRLKRADWLQALHMDRQNEVWANEYAYRRGLVAVTNGDDAVPLQGPESERGLISERDNEKLESIFGREFSQIVGRAVIAASGDLTVAEKKPSAS